LHLYRKKIKKPKIEENSKEAKRCCISTVNPKLQLKRIEVIATQGGRDLKDLFFTHRTVKVNPHNEEAKIVVKEEPQTTVKDGRSFVEKFLFYKELERQLSVEEEKVKTSINYVANITKIEEKNKSLFRKAIIIKPIDPVYAFHK